MAARRDNRRGGGDDGDERPPNFVRYTSSDEKYPTDVRDETNYWKNWSRVLGEVTDQGNQDTCWVHATIECLEALLRITFELDTSLSAKHLYHGIQKKKGNSAVKIFEEIRSFLKIEGIVKEKDCECDKRTNKKDPCSKKIKENIVKVLKINELVIKKVNEEELIELVKLGPVMVSIEATEELKAHRGEGIFFGPKISKKPQGDHVVLVTGYNSIDGQHYWIIRNSWGIKWGDKGYAKIARQISRGKDQHSLFSEIIYSQVSAAPVAGFV